MYDELVKRLRTMADWTGISSLDESENVRINLSEAADAIEETCVDNDRLYKAVINLTQTVTGLVRELNKQKWVPVTDHTSKYSGYYLVCDNDDDVYTAYFGNTTKHWWTERVVTHWMPRPEPPKKETSKGDTEDV